MKIPRRHPQRGFICLIVLIVSSAVLLIFAALSSAWLQSHKTNRARQITLQSTADSINPIQYLPVPVESQAFGTLPDTRQIDLVDDADQTGGSRE